MRFIINENQLLAAAAFVSVASAAGTRAGSTSVELKADAIQEALLKHKEVTLHAWNTLKDTATVRPLDLKLDPDDYTVVYQTGEGGFLQPYNDETYQSYPEEHVDLNDDPNLPPNVVPVEIKPLEYIDVSRKLDFESSSPALVSNCIQQFVIAVNSL